MKLQRSKEHIDQLHTEIQAFFQSDLNYIIGETDLESHDRIIRMVVGEPPPKRWGAIAGDCIHNLRSSLDILYALVTGERGKRSFFPVYNTAEEYTKRFGGHKHATRQPAMNLFAAAKGYPGGNDLLYALKVISDEDKHHSLIPILTWMRPSDLHFRAPGADPAAFLKFMIDPAGLEPIESVENGTILYRIPVAAMANGEMDMNLQFTAEIAFAEPEIVRGKPLVPTLHQIGHMVQEIGRLFHDAGLLP